MKTFSYDVVLDEENLCDLDEPRRRLRRGLAAGRRFVVFGRRNTGKTSLMKSAVIPDFRKAVRKKPALVLFADLLGVRDIAEIDQRIRRAFARAIAEAFPARRALSGILDLLKNLRPTLTIDPVEGPVLSLAVGEPPGALPFGRVSAELGKLHKHGKVTALIVLDEFQDVAEAGEGEALMRDALQNLPGDLPVVLMGSKKHLMSRVIAAPGAPLAGYGEDLEVGPIPYEKYREYIQERLKPDGLTIDLETASFLQDGVQRIPESVNIVAAMLTDVASGRRPRAVTKDDVIGALKLAIERRQGRFEEYLAQFSAGEERFLIELARRGAVSAPTGKDFVAATGLSTSGVARILKKLENAAVIYNEAAGYVIADPILAHYLKRYR